METHLTKLAKYVQKGKVFIFSVTYCPYCVKAKDLFSKLGVNYGIIEADVSNDFSDEFEEFLNKHAKIDTFPKIFIGLDCVGGFSDAKQLLDENKFNKKLF